MVLVSGNCIFDFCIYDLSCHHFEGLYCACICHTFELIVLSLSSGYQGCPYGDKEESCKEVKDKPSRCYSDADVCCKSCREIKEKLNHDDPGKMDVS